MTRILPFFLLTLLFLSCCSSCSDEKAPALKPEFSIAETDLQHDCQKEQTNISIPVKTNLSADEWSVKSNEDWCLATISRSTSQPSITIVVKANEEPDVRSTTVTVKTPISEHTIRINQLGYGKAVLLKKSSPKIDAAGGQMTVTVTANVEYDIQMPKEQEWITQAPATKALTDYDHDFHIAPNKTYESRTAEISFIARQDPEVKAVCVIEQAALNVGTDEVEATGDILIKPTGGTASENQPGQGIEHCFDGVFGGTPYHSVWGQPAQFPVTLEFTFDGKEEIDYFIYHTRAGNGNFGEVDVFTATEAAPEYKLYGSFDFKKQNAPSKVIFNSPLKNATKIKFSVKSGAGDFVSCDEMQFFKNNVDDRLKQQLLTVFTDASCSELKEGITDAQINALPPYFAQIGTYLKNDKYDAWEKKFRIRDYQPYSDVELWAEKLMTKRYSNLDNPTGIYAEAGDSILVLVGDTHGQSVSIQLIPDVEAGGDTYFLHEGVNKIGIRRKGMLFIMYTADLLSPSAKPVRIHIPLNSGTVNGFFDLKEDQTDAAYAELLRKATYKYFCVRGEKIMFYFHLSKMREYLPNNILSAIHLWDNIIGWQQELMGIDDVRPSQVNNHIFAISPEDGYMWASDYRIGFVYTYLNNILLYDNVMAAKDNAWGPAHEIGHIHQRAINWPSSTESSNNLFSNYILYKLGKYCSRGSELSALATARCINGNAWYNMGTSTHQNEDTEIHMRMNWQLWNYYHRCGYQPDFWQKLFRLLRENRISESDPGAGQLLFARMACQAANQNLTEFFERWGFFEPVDNVTIEQYGSWNYNVTPRMISETKAFMARFPAPRHAFYYLEDRKNGDVGIDNYKVGDVGHYSQFKNNQKISKTPKYSRSGQRISISNGDEAVAFEVKKGDKLLFFSNFLSFEVPSSIALEGCSIYAVQADGHRKQVMAE